MTGFNAETTPGASAFYVMDRGHIDFDRLHRLNLSAAFFAVRGRYQRAGRDAGYRNGYRERGLLDTFDPVRLPVPRVRPCTAAQA